MHRTYRRRGFALRELVVIIVIIVVMICLFLPALRQTRGPSRRLQCASNLRQVGLGLLGYLNSTNGFPNAGTFGESAATAAKPGTDPRSSIIATALGVDGTPAFAGAVRKDPIDSTDYGPLHSWAVDILPYIDNQDVYDGWDRTRLFHDAAINASGSSNLTASQTDVGILRCPEDLTVVRGKGNLSYVVNGGFARWWAVPTWGWTSTPLGGQSDGAGTDWSGKGDLQYNQSIAQQTGVMFLGTASGSLPWDAKTTPRSIVDGTALTVLATENQWAGAAPWDQALLGPNPGAAAASWATPHPNFCMFIGSDKICGTSGNCVTAGLGTQTTTPPADGAGWKYANFRQAAYRESINAGNSAAREGYSPFPNSGHSGGVNVLFCDGSVRYVPDTVDGTVWAKALTPQGSKLPSSAEPGMPSYRQLPFDINDLE